jgi:hypothetical protein
MWYMRESRSEAWQKYQLSLVSSGLLLAKKFAHIFSAKQRVTERPVICFFVLIAQADEKPHEATERIAPAQSPRVEGLHTWSVGKSADATDLPILAAVN